MEWHEKTAGVRETNKLDFAGPGAKVQLIRFSSAGQQKHRKSEKTPKNKKNTGPDSGARYSLVPDVLQTLLPPPIYWTVGNSCSGARLPKKRKPKSANTEPLMSSPAKDVVAPGIGIMPTLDVGMPARDILRPQVAPFATRTSPTSGYA